MDNNLGGRLVKTVEELRATVDESNAKLLEFGKTEKVIHKLASFSVGCTTCEKHLKDLEDALSYISDNVDHLSETTIKNYSLQIQTMIAHLEKEHNIVSEGHYLSFGLALGPS